MTTKARPYAKTEIVGELHKIEYPTSSPDFDSGNIKEPTLARLRIKTWERKSETDEVTGKKSAYFDYSYHPVVVYAYLLKRLEQFQEGDSIRVEGKPQSRVWGDPNGRGGVVYEVKATKLEHALTKTEAKALVDADEQPIAPTERKPVHQYNSHHSSRHANQRQSYQTRSGRARYDER